jgi:ribosomal protein L31
MIAGESGRIAMPRTARRVMGVLLAALILVGAGGVAWATWSSQVAVSAGVSSGSWSQGPAPDPGGRGSGVLVAGDGTAFTTPVTWKDWTSSGPVDVADSLNGQTNRGRRMCAEVTVRSTGGGAGPWRVVVDYSGAPFYGTRPTYWDGAVTDLDDHRLQITSYQPLAAGETASLSLCHADMSTPAAVTDQGTWQVALGDLRSDTLAGNPAICRTATITGTTDAADYPFYYGWSTTVDPAELVSAFRELRGVDAQYFSVVPDPSGGEQMTLDGATSNRIRLDGSSRAHTVTSGWQTALQGRGVYTFSACVTQW